MDPGAAPGLAQSGTVGPAPPWRGLARSRGTHTRGHSRQQGRGRAPHTPFPSSRFQSQPQRPRPYKRPHRQTPAVSLRLSAPTFPMGVGTEGPYHSWHQPSAVMLVAETASRVLPQPRTPRTRSSETAPAPRLLVHWLCAPDNTAGVRGASRAAGKGA